MLALRSCAYRPTDQPTTDSTSRDPYGHVESALESALGLWGSEHRRFNLTHSQGDWPHWRGDRRLGMRRPFDGLLLATIRSGLRAREPRLGQSVRVAGSCLSRLVAFEAELWLNCATTSLSATPDEAGRPSTCNRAVFRRASGTMVGCRTLVRTSSRHYSSPGRQVRQHRYHPSGNKKGAYQGVQSL